MILGMRKYCRQLHNVVCLVCAGKSCILDKLILQSHYLQQLDEFGDGLGGEISIVLIIDQVNHCTLQHLGRLTQTLHGCLHARVDGGLWNLHALIQCFGKHGRTDALRTRLIHLLAYVCKWNNQMYIGWACYTRQWTQHTHTCTAAVMKCQ